MATDDDIKKWELEYNLNEERKVFLKKKKEEKLKQNILSVLKFSSLYIISPILISIFILFALNWIISNIWTGLLINPASILNPNHYSTFTYYFVLSNGFIFSFYFLRSFDDFFSYKLLKKIVIYLGIFISGFILSFIVGLFYADAGLDNISQRGDIFDANDYSMTIAYILSGLGLIVCYIILIVKWFKR